MLSFNLIAMDELVHESKGRLLTLSHFLQKVIEAETFLCSDSYKGYKVIFVNIGEDCMKIMNRLFLILIGLVLSHVVFAQSEQKQEATITNIQLPAWVERNGELMALRVDRPLVSGDVIVTGSSGRVLADLPDGSDLKIGSDARFVIQKLVRVKERIQAGVQNTQEEIKEKVQQTTEEIVEAAFEIPRGAFRYTTRTVGRLVKRAITVKVGFATVGIRGTDFWGQSADGLDTVCLIEGAIAIDKEGQATVDMTDALTFYRGPHTGDPEPVSAVDMAQLGEWAASVEVSEGSGVISANGGWSVYLGSFKSSDNAQALAQQLDVLGYPAEVMAAEPVSQLYRVTVKGFISYQDALWLINASDSIGVKGIEGAWLSKTN